MMQRCFVYVILFCQLYTSMLVPASRSSGVVNVRSLGRTTRTLQACFRLAYSGTLLRLRLGMRFPLILLS